MQLFLFFMPGILLIFSRDFNKKPLTEFLVYVIGLSLSFFVVMPWFIKYLNAPLMFSAYIIFIVSAAVMVMNIKKIDMKHLVVDRQELVLIGIFLIVLILRCAPILFQIAPAGADMSMHSYIARLIYDNDGIPSSYEPILPISHFGAYPSGFPTLSALVSLLSDLPVYRSSLLMACLAHALICFGLYVLLLRFFDRNTAAASAIAATFLTRSPQWIVRWGGNPTVLALFFFIVAFSLVVELKEKTSLLKTAFASLSLAAALLSHSIVFYVGGVIIAAYFLLSLKDFEYIYATALCLFIFMLVFLLPYLAGLRFTVTKSALEFAKTWQAIDAKSVFYDLIGGSPFIVLSFIGLPMLIKKNRPLASVFLVITAVLILLMFNYRFWVMPFSYLLYPGRIALFLLAPLAVFASPVISKIIGSQKKYLLIVFLLIGFVFYCAFYMFNSISMCSMTKADVDAFKWMDNTISKSAVIKNNYGDAGLWIPAMIGRTITAPHSEPVHMEELEAGLAKLKADYIYIGSKAVYGVDLKKEALEKKPWKYRRIFSNDGAQVWKVL